MAHIYIKCERYNEAISEIEYLLAQESIFTVNNFKDSKEYEPLYDMPEYQALMKKYALEPGI